MAERTDILAVAHWTKQATAVVCGVAFGTTGSIGWNPILTFFAALATSAYAAMKFTGVYDRLLYDDQADMLKEGFPTAVALFFLVWTITFTFLHS